MFQVIAASNFMSTCRAVRQMVDDERTHTVLVSAEDYEAIPEQFRAEMAQCECSHLRKLHNRSLLLIFVLHLHPLLIQTFWMRCSLLHPRKFAGS